MRLIAKLILVLSVWPMVGFAEDTTDSCGLGWEVMADKTLLGTSVRATTNYVVPPSFGMTSGTLGCDQHGIAAVDAEKANYAVTNFETLKVEMAIGQGETLQGLSEVMGCSSDFNAVLKANYTNIYGSDEVSAIEMFRNVKTLAAQSCASV